MLKVLHSFGFAWSGILYVIKTEQNFKIHLLATFTVIVLGFYYNLSNFEWLYVILLIGIVLSAELFNSAIEKVVDFISPHQHEKAGIIKDISAGAVLIISISAFICGMLILLPKIISNI